MLTSLEPVTNLAKRRGFFFPSAEIYNGAAGLFDLGPLGVELNNNLKKLWWRRFVLGRDDVVGLDSAILTPAAVLRASGHVDNFSDPLIECGNCHIRLRADHYLEEEDIKIWIIRWLEEAARQRGLRQGNNEPLSSKKDETEATEAAERLFDFNSGTASVLRPTAGYADLTCPNPACRKRQFGPPKSFNMMFPTQLGSVEGEGAQAYLRPETCQGIFTNFKQLQLTSRLKLPFGIAQVGKAFRNEITIGNSLYRVREFEQLELEYFVKPGEDEAAYETWLLAAGDFLREDLALSKEKLRQYEHPKAKLAHYSKRTIDYEYNFPGSGYGELYGIANRTDYDLSQHQQASGRDLTYFDEEKGEKYIPYVIEPSAGVGRLLLATLAEHYREYPEGRDGQSGELETVLHLPKRLAPVAVAVLPLMKKDGLAEKAREVKNVVRELLPERLVQYDESGAIGRRYRRQDEVGTPYALTIDYQTLNDDTLTVRDRDDMSQKRVAIGELGAVLKDVI